MQGSSAPPQPTAPALGPAPTRPRAFNPLEAAQTQFSQFTMPAATATRQFNLPSWATPFGSLSTRQTGEVGGIPQYTTELSLSPEQQALQTQRTGLMTQAGGLIGGGMSSLYGALSKPLDLTNEAVEGRLVDLGSRRLDPMLQRAREADLSRLATQGIMPGSEAYREAVALRDRAETDARNQLLLEGRSQAFNEALTGWQAPIQAWQGGLAALQPWTPTPTMPTAPAALPTVGVEASPFGQLASTGYGTDVGAYTAETGQRGQQAQQTYAQQMQAWADEAAAKRAREQGLWGALGGIGGTVLGGPLGGALGNWATGGALGKYTLSGYGR